MARKEKSTNLYRTPFCAGYWRDALAELKDTKMLVFAAMIVVMRVALKTIIRIPLGPSLDITPAFMANALGAMVYGPFVGAIGAIVSDVLGVMLRGDTYFLPYVLTEISGTSSSPCSSTVRSSPPPASSSAASASACSSTSCCRPPLICCSSWSTTATTMWC